MICHGISFFFIAVEFCRIILWDIYAFDLNKVLNLAGWYHLNYICYPIRGKRKCDNLNKGWTNLSREEQFIQNPLSLLFNVMLLGNLKFCLRRKIVQFDVKILFELNLKERKTRYEEKYRIFF